MDACIERGPYDGEHCVVIQKAGSTMALRKEALDNLAREYERALDYGELEREAGFCTKLTSDARICGKTMADGERYFVLETLLNRVTISWGDYCTLIGPLRTALVGDDELSQSVGKKFAATQNLAEQPVLKGTLVPATGSCQEYLVIRRGRCAAALTKRSVEKLYEERQKAVFFFGLPLDEPFFRRLTPYTKVTGKAVPDCKRRCLVLHDMGTRISLSWDDYCALIGPVRNALIFNGYKGKSKTERRG